MTSFSGVTFSLVLLRFRLYDFVEAAALCSIVLRYASAPVATRISFFFPLVYLECRFFRVFYFILYHFRFLLLIVCRVRRTFFPPGWCFFYLVTTGWIFDISLCENSINQSIRKIKSTCGHIFLFPMFRMQGWKKFGKVRKKSLNVLWAGWDSFPTSSYLQNNITININTLFLIHFIPPRLATLPLRKIHIPCPTGSTCPTWAPPSFSPRKRPRLA